MTRLENDTVIRALLRQPTPYTPVWVMRQAGRYLPEYNKTRAKAGDFMALCRNPDLATEVTLQPLARFALDAAIVFSDILTIPDAMGLGLHFADGEGPRFEHPLRDQEAICRLEIPDPVEHLGYVLEAVGQIRRALAGRVPLIGFAGSPFTLACYMVEGGASTEFRILKTMMYARPDLLHRILEVNCRAVIGYLNAQIDAGADAVMIFDTWGGILTAPAFHEFSLAYLRRIIEGLGHGKRVQPVPSIVFTKGGGQWLRDLATVGASAISIDWTTDIGAARAVVGQDVALQGNLDPSVLLANPEVIRQETQRVLAAFGQGNGHVFNLGHGIGQFTPPEHVGVLVDAVHELSRPYH